MIALGALVAALVGVWLVLAGIERLREVRSLVRADRDRDRLA